jgi:hypothetical protein
MTTGALELQTAALVTETTAAEGAAVAETAAGVAGEGMLATLALPLGVLAVAGVAAGAAIYVLMQNTTSYADIAKWSIQQVYAATGS